MTVVWVQLFFKSQAQDNPETSNELLYLLKNSK